jgi:hypothetical protein
VSRILQILCILCVRILFIACQMPLCEPSLLTAITTTTTTTTTTSVIMQRQIRTTPSTPYMPRANLYKLQGNSATKLHLNQLHPRNNA